MQREIKRTNYNVTGKGDEKGNSDCAATSRGTTKWTDDKPRVTSLDILIKTVSRRRRRPTWEI